MELIRTRVVYSEIAFAELVLWQLPAPLPGSARRFKYRLAYVVDAEYVLRYDNESSKGTTATTAARRVLTCSATPTD